MFEKVNPAHPDKVCDRIAGALVDLGYAKEENPKIAIEVLLGHGKCYVIAETSVHFDVAEVEAIVHRIAGAKITVEYTEVPQDAHLAGNQEAQIRCGDNGIFKGAPVTDEQNELAFIAREIYRTYNCDGKYVLDDGKLIICQSNASQEDLAERYPSAVINPLGDWTGGTDVDTGATNRKLGSDMGDSVTGGGLHGKDLSKADVSANIYAWIKAQEIGEEFMFSCAIGDTEIDGVPYSEIVETAREFISEFGGFEKFAEWGLI